MSRKPNILICNDDGIHAPGIRHLWNAVKDLGNCTVVAPAEQQSGKGLSITLHSPLRMRRVDWGDADAYYATGTPADSVKLALRLLFEEPPDLIVSGVNKGSNAGRNVLYSGTIGCVIEGVLRGIPGIAFSCTGADHIKMQDPAFAETEAHIRQITEYILAHPLKEGSLLNVNFPDQARGVRWARQGLEYWLDELEQRHDPAGHPYCWLGGVLNSFPEAEDSDVALLKQGYATAVPLQVSELTDHGLYNERRQHFEQHFSLE